MSNVHLCFRVYGHPWCPYLESFQLKNLDMSKNSNRNIDSDGPCSCWCLCPPKLCIKICNCSKTTLKGESRFHISTPLGIEPGSLMTGIKRVVHLTSKTWYECSEIAGSQQGSPPAADYVGCEAGRRTCSKRETETGKLCEIKWDYHTVGTTA
jgi:hypothetical protein